jgi:hypothetical protein
MAGRRRRQCPVGTEEVGTWELACVQLRTQFVDQRPIKAEGHHGSDAISFELLQLPKNGITIVVLGCGFEADEDAHMGVIRDESGYDGLARIVDDFRITGNRRSRGRTNGDDASVADDNRGIIYGSAARSIDYAGAT